MPFGFFIAIAIFSMLVVGVLFVIPGLIIIWVAEKLNPSPAPEGPPKYDFEPKESDDVQVDPGRESS